MGSDKDSSDDCYIGDDFQRIPVQLARLEEIPEIFWVDQQVNEVIEGLIPWGRNAALRARVIIRFETVPRGREEIRNFNHQFVLLLKHICEQEDSQLSIRKSLEFRAMTSIFKYLSEFTILDDKTEDFDVPVVEHEKWQVMGTSVEQDAEFLLKKIKPKVQKYNGQKDLLIVFDVFPGWPSKHVLNLISEELTAWNPAVGQIWMVSLANDGYSEMLFNPAK